MSKARAIKRQRQLKATQYIRQLRREAMASTLAVVRTWPWDQAAQWGELARRAGLNPPSPDTVAVILKRMSKLYSS
jgi:hypothetical protein